MTYWIACSYWSLLIVSLRVGISRIPNGGVEGRVMVRLTCDGVVVRRRRRGRVFEFEKGKSFISG